MRASSREGEYGAGRVIVWDHGTYDSDRDMSDALERGHLSFRLDGEKLHGGFALTRFRRGKDEAWLLVKKSDEDADGRRKPVRSQPESVLTGPHARRVVVIADLPDDVRGALRDEKVPRWRAPTLATLTDERFSDPDWIFERKLDGVRGLAFRDGDQVRLLSRNQLSLNDTYPEIVEALANQDTSAFVIDGEIVAFEGRRTSFARLQGRSGITDPDEALASRIPVFYYVFDVLHLDGSDVTSAAPTRAEKAAAQCVSVPRSAALHHTSRQGRRGRLSRRM